MPFRYWCESRCISCKFTYHHLFQSIFLLGGVALACLALDLLFLFFYSIFLCCRRNKSEAQPNADCCCTAWCVIIATLVCRLVWTSLQCQNWWIKWTNIEDQWTKMNVINKFFGNNLITQWHMKTDKTAATIRADFSFVVVWELNHLGVFCVRVSCFCPSTDGAPERHHTRFRLALRASGAAGTGFQSLYLFVFVFTLTCLSLLCFPSRLGKYNVTLDDEPALHFSFFSHTFGNFSPSLYFVFFYYLFKVTRSHSGEGFCSPFSCCESWPGNNLLIIIRFPLRCS